MSARRIAALVRARGEGSFRGDLARIADIALGYAPTVGVTLGGPQAPPLDTVYLDLTGCAHLHGGEEALSRELAARLRELDHPVRVAIAEGPRIARALALFADTEVTIARAGEGRAAFFELPLEALLLDDATLAFLARAGLEKVGELASLPRKTLLSRLGPRAREALSLLAGHDDVPLTPYEPPRAPTEEIEWEAGVSSLEALLFALRGLIARLSARLEGRGEAAGVLEVGARYDASIAELRGVTRAEKTARVELPAPLSREADLFRVLKAKLETWKLEAPVTRLSLAAALVVRAPRVQLDLSRDVSVSPDAWPVLLAELSAELGQGGFGLLALVPTHRPEAKTALVPPPSTPRRWNEAPPSLVCLPTRLLPEPVPLARALAIGETVAIAHCTFTIEALRHQMRLDRVEWWSLAPLSRDYARVSLASKGARVEAWVYRDLLTGARYLQGYFD